MHAKRIFACPCSSDESLCTICKAEKKYPIIIKACDCQVHEKCLRETIQADLTQSSRISTKYPDYQEYKCPTCSKTILYKEGFPRSGVPCS